MSEKQPLYLVVSLDVEEEGLFGGYYARRGFTTRNTSGLKDLASFCGMGIRPTLFCAHSVLSDPTSCETLTWLRDAHHAEIGAHLHHWNTPPLTLDGTDHTLPDTAARVPAAEVSDALFFAKLAALMEEGKALQGPPMTGPCLLLRAFFAMPRCGPCTAQAQPGLGQTTLTPPPIPTG